MRIGPYRACAGFCSLAVALAVAQTFRITVDLVQVDVAVTDSKGGPVKDLSAGDFQVLQDGKPQKITAFSFIENVPGAVERRAPEAKAPAVSLPVARAAPVGRPEQVHRAIGFIIDDITMTADGILNARRAVEKFLAEQMQPGDLVAVLRATGGSGALQQFTSDKRMLEAAVREIRPRLMYQIPATAQGRLGSLHFVIEGLREVPGRKAVVYFSSALPLVSPVPQPFVPVITDPSDPPPPELGVYTHQAMIDALRRLAGEANRASVVMYTVEPTGLTNFDFDSGTHSVTTSGTLPVNTAAAAEPFRRDGLAKLAQETGGLFLKDVNASGILQEILRDQEGYYLIGYHPNAASFDEKTGKRMFQQLTVKVARPGVRVRFRNGFVGEFATAPSAADQLQRALNSPFAGDLPVRLLAVFSNRTGQSARPSPSLDAFLQVGLKDISLTRTPESNYTGALEVVLAAFSAEGRTLSQINQRVPIQLSESTYRDSQEGCFMASIHAPLKAGSYQVRAAVRDVDTGKTGSASHFLEVPDTSKGKLLLSTILLAEEAENGNAEIPGSLAMKSAEETPVMRVFRPGRTVTYAFQILNAHSDAQGRSEVEEQVVLYRDGAPIYAGKPAVHSFGPGGDPATREDQGRLKLQPQIRPGNYILYIVVADKLNPGKAPAVAAQSMDFTIEK
jgi:VWFA-related protein